MKVYLDTTIIQVLLFNRFTPLDQERLPETQALFAAIDQMKSTRLSTPAHPLKPCAG